MNHGGRGHADKGRERATNVRGARNTGGGAVAAVLVSSGRCQRAHRGDSHAAVRILGETLVLFRDKKGRVGLLDDRSHTAGLRSVMVVSKSGALPAHTMVGFMTREGIGFGAPAEPSRASFI